MNYIKDYRNPEITQKLVKKIRNLNTQKIRLMEVCGTHTVSIFRSGVRSLLPGTIKLLSGPGCPVCVTDQTEIDAFLALSKEKNVIITTFGDLVRVPGSNSSLQQEKAQGADVRIVYSTFDALKIAKENPNKNVVFLGVGFETTAPTIAASILSAQQMKISNFSVYSAHKLVPPALFTLMSSKATNIDGFILPGHVSVIIGISAYQPFFDKFQTPCVITGFEPVDLLQGIFMLTSQIESGSPRLENSYPRAVTHKGNQKAQNIIQKVFEKVDAKWRGIGIIPKSGLKINPEFKSFDAEYNFDIIIPESMEPKGCACGEILTGVKTPPQCPLYKNICTPIDPVGPCMVSSEGTCAAYYRYHDFGE